ncbi:PP2C family protein-serine/threonine phosphatase [Mucilaginibacter glaciei]|uniref:Serine/threonine-protein phosphatase n=1 Tax=Mucilaginibacter glaciei TaxID=2772109 RepID=A0A926NN16_9SPHI|nr:protein phosphatase 2C domain-containing protein [Mucilaginibacter glaciei]MBD1391537.1 serine/threonine-protein phosphatase [Mucilaginibacter glaciei]
MAENYFGLTDVGKVRDNNEDTFIAETVSGNLILASVIDGVGGYNGGEVAAAIAKDVLTDNLSNLKGDYIPAMIEALKQASAAIYQKKQTDAGLESMACVVTVTLVDVPNNIFYYAHVGDTRLYLLRDESLVKISKDHSFVGFLEDSGRLTETAAMNHPKRNEINKALGFTTQIDTDESFIETGSSPFLPGDMLLLCSDGLTDLVDKTGITFIITQEISLKEKATQLIDAANTNGGKDNVTAVLVRNDKTKERPQAIKPAPVIKKNTDAADAEMIPNRPVAAPQKIQPQSTPPMAEKKSNGLTILLAILCLAFAASTVWLYLQWQKGIAPVTVAGVKPLERDAPIRNPDEIKLQNMLNSLKKDTLNISDTSFKQAIIISDTLHLQRDTIYIRGKGNIVLKRDTAYHGPAIDIAAACKLVALDNIKFEGFDVGVSLFNTTLLLRGAQFIDCRVAVQRQVFLANKMFIIADMPGSKIKADTAAKATPKPHGTR